jgi:hypothetical protein
MWWPGHPFGRDGHEATVGNPQRPCQPVSAARQQDRPEAAVEIEFGLSLAKVLNFRINGFGVGSCANLFFCARRSCCF